MAKERYSRLKTTMHNAHFTDNMTVNLENFREEAAAHLDGPGQYENVPFLKIWKNLEGKGVIGVYKLDILKKLVETAGGKAHLHDMINEAEEEIQRLSDNVPHSPDVVYVRPRTTGQHSPDGVPERKRTMARHSPQHDTSGDAGEFHKRENTTMPFEMIESIGKSGLNKSIGLIKIEIPGYLSGSGTGFRVGKFYVMTAYHVLKEIIKHVRDLIIRKIERSDQKEAIYKKITEIFKMSQDEFEASLFHPKEQALPFGQLICYMEEMGLATEVFEDKWKKAVRINFGMTRGKTTAGKFNFEYDIQFADKDHDVVVLQVTGDVSDLPPPLRLEKDIVAPTVYLFGYPVDSTDDLKSDVRCEIYDDARVLKDHVTKAIKYWKERRPSVEGRPSVEKDFADCCYVKGTLTPTNKMILHTSPGFEHRTSGCPAITMINRQPVVQLMYLRGYPEFCYSQRQLPSPPQEYLFEAGVPMPVVTRLLQKFPHIME